MSEISSKLPVQLRRRRDPNQTRSREAVERILDASAYLLAEHGVEKLTTRRIASRAEVNVSTLYQFFPNKHAIIYALYEDWLETAKDVFENADDALPAAVDWPSFFTAIMKDMRQVELSADLKTRLKQAMSVYEDLRALDHEHAQWAIGKISAYIHHFAPQCPHDCCRSIAILMLDRDFNLADHQLRHGPELLERLDRLTLESVLHLLSHCIEQKKLCAE